MKNTSDGCAKYVFTNCEGHEVALNGKMTLADLVRLGITLRLESRETPKTGKPEDYYHDPKDTPPTHRKKTR